MSEKRIAANRANARRSTGPRTCQGKLRSSRNALRHGLSIPIGRAPEFAQPIAEFAQQLVGDDASAEELDLATKAAKGHFDVVRVRQSRERMFNREVSVDLLQNPGALKALASLDRYEERATSRRKKALQQLQQVRRLPLVG